MYFCQASSLQLFYVYLHMYSWLCACMPQINIDQCTYKLKSLLLIHSQIMSNIIYGQSFMQFTWTECAPPTQSPVTSPPLHKVPQWGGTNVVVARYHLARNLCNDSGWSLLSKWRYSSVHNSVIVKDTSEPSGGVAKHFKK